MVYLKGYRFKRFKTCQYLVTFDSALKIAKVALTDLGESKSIQRSETCSVTRGTSQVGTPGYLNKAQMKCKKQIRAMDIVSEEIAKLVWALTEALSGDDLKRNTKIGTLALCQSQLGSAKFASNREIQKFAKQFGKDELESLQRFKVLGKKGYDDFMVFFVTCLHPKSQLATKRLKDEAGSRGNAHIAVDTDLKY